jgi:hypothetical protein
VPGVWWCDGHGALLSDGLWVGERVFGAVVNLTGTIRPELSVDRNKILRHSAPDAVDNLLLSAVPALAEVRSFTVTHQWMCNLTESFPIVADATLDYLVGTGTLAWLGGQGERVDAGNVGCFPLDGELPGTTRDAQPAPSQHYYSSMPDFVVFWRLRCWAHAGRPPDGAGKPDAVAGRPSDHALLLWQWGLAKQWIYRTSVSLVEVLFLAGQLRRTPQEVAKRLADVGVAVPNLGKVAVDELTPADLVVLSVDLEGGYPLYEISRGHLLVAARRTGRSVGELTERLAALGLAVPSTGAATTQVSTIDLVLLSKNLDGKGPWLGERLVPRGHLLTAALQTGLSAGEVRARLSRLGLAAADPTPRPNSVIDTADVPLLSRDLDGGEWLGAAPVELGHVLAAAARTSAPPQSVTRRLRDLGFVAADIPVTDVRPDDIEILSEYRSGKAPWIDCEPIYRPDVFQKARVSGVLPRRVAERLTEFGFVVADVGPAGDTALDDTESYAPTFADRYGDGNRISLVRLLNTASGAGRRVDEVGDWLQYRGYAVPDTSGFEYTTDDRILLSDDLSGDGIAVGGRSNRGGGIGIAHVLVASLRLRRPPSELASRIRFFGLPVADPDGAEASNLTPKDLVLLSKDLDPLGPWLDDTPVPPTHILAAAAATGHSPGEIARTLSGLGIQVGDHRDVEFSPDDHDMLTTALDHLEPRPDNCHDVGLAAVLATAYRTRRTPKDIAERLTDVGLAVPRPQTHSAAESAEDLVLLSAAIDGEGPWLPGTQVPYVHLLAAAGRIGRSPAEVTARFAAMGFDLPPPPFSPAPGEVDVVDLVLLSRNLDGAGPWLDQDSVPTAYLLLAACVLRCSTSEIRGRLAALGLSVADADDVDITAVDRAILAVIFDGGKSEYWANRYSRQAWSTGPDPISVAQVLAAAEFTGRPIGDISDRITHLGLPAPATQRHAGPVDQTDMLLVSRRLNGRGPWCGSGPVPLGHVIAAAGYLRWPPARIVARLAELGLDPPTLTDAASTAYIDGVDIALVSASRKWRAPTLADKRVSRAHILANSYYFALPIPRVTERLVELGFTVQDADALKS